MPEGGVWYLPSPDGEGSFVFGAHAEDACSDACPLHSPTPHWARGMPLRWRYESGAGGRMERLCPHGGWHDDPDDLAFRRRRGGAPTERGWKRCDCPCDCAHEVPF